MRRDIACRLHDVGEPPHRPRRCRAAGAEFWTVKRFHQPQHERQIEQRIEQNAVRGAEPQQEHP
ncbi:MAG: hypothetical protein WBE71_19655, partial [Xanthobacteraceae bacterium]